MESPNVEQRARRQRLFDISLNHIRAQGRPAFYYGICRYKVDSVYTPGNSLGCGAAPFIEDYSPEMEGMSWGQLCLSFPGALNPDAIVESGFVGMLQKCHDENAVLDNRSRVLGTFMANFEMSMANVARLCLLAYKEPVTGANGQ